MFEGFYYFNKGNTVKPISDKYLICTHNYSFNSEKTRYLVQVEQYPLSIYIIKFHRKQDKGRKDRYNILTAEFKCVKIVSTCIRILISIYKKDALASFGFLGANCIGENGNGDEPKSNTKRFRIYKRAMENLISEDLFFHSMDIRNSTYLMVNKRHESVDDIINKAKHMFEDIFPALES